MEIRLNMRAKLTLSLLSIALVLLISSIISTMEYSRMSSYVSDLIADDISSINAARQISDEINSYNLEILAIIGDEKINKLPDVNYNDILSHCDSLKRKVSNKHQMLALADSVIYSYSAYMLTSVELERVLNSPFVDSRNWFFERLEPHYARLTRDIDLLSNAIYKDLQKNSETFERGFYRSIIPGIVAVGVGLLLIIMLLFYLLIYYVNPLHKMRDALEAYRSVDKKYVYKFDGDDELVEINDGVSELANENQQLRSRLSALRKIDNNRQ